jgi:glycosyltransferase involved in cell wall biosynthesis
VTQTGPTNLTAEGCAKPRTVADGTPTVRRDQPLVSVVTPVHNGAKFLRECIESVLAQSYENWEQVIVDNASTDETLDVARSYADRDPRIRVVAHREFVDVIASFNRAFGEMSPTAEYCKPLAADDYLFPECLERMVALAERDRTIGLVSGQRTRNNRTTDLHGLPEGIDVVPGPEICRATLLGGIWVFGGSSTVLVRAEHVRDRKPFYSAGHVYADMDSCYEVLRNTSFGFVHDVCTFIRWHEEAITHRNVQAGIHTATILKVFVKNGPVYLTYDEYQRRLAVVLFFYLRDVARLRNLRDREYRRVFGETVRWLRTAVAPRELAQGVWLQLRRMVDGERETGGQELERRIAAGNGSSQAYDLSRGQGRDEATG